MNFVIIKQCWTLTLIFTLLSYNGFLQLSCSHLTLVTNHKCRAVNRKVWLRVETLDYIGYTDSAVFKGLPGNLESSFQKVKLWFVTLKKKQSTLVQRWWIFFYLCMCLHYLNINTCDWYFRLLYCENYFWQKYIRCSQIIFKSHMFEMELILTWYFCRWS